MSTKIEFNPFKWRRKSVVVAPVAPPASAKVSQASTDNLPPNAPPTPTQTAVPETHTMNIFALILSLVPSIVKGIQSVVGDKQSGATKAQMAQDALQAAVSGAGQVLTGSNLQYSQIAGAVAQVAIDQTVAISKASGDYGKWTAIATAAQQDASVAQQVVAGVQSISAPQAPAAAPAPPAPTPAPTTPAGPATT